MRKPFIRFEKLKPFDIVAIVIYSIFTLGVLVNYYLGTAHSKQVMLIAYAVTAQIFMYFFLYVSLRNFTSFLIWSGFSFVHILMYLIFKGNSELIMVRGNPSFQLINTSVLLVLFQLLRYFSIKMQHREFVVPSKGGGKDLFENKEISPVDYVVLLIYMASWFGLTVYGLH
jgi:hypothetical protein